MKIILLSLVVLTISILTACESPVVNTNMPVGHHDSPAAMPTIPKDGMYDAKGKVTKINPALGSIELDHDDIPGLMPPMIMEFNVKDKAMLDSVKVGDAVDFVVEYIHPTETIVTIKKAQ